jgi:hypothetical protein
MEPAQLQAMLELAKLGAIVTSVFVIGTTIAVAIAFHNAGPNKAKTFMALIEKTGALQLVTVLNIIVAIVILAFVGKISSEGANSIYSGIAGYVLGGLRSSPRMSRPGRDEESSS